MQAVEQQHILAGLMSLSAFTLNALPGMAGPAYSSERQNKSTGKSTAVAHTQE